MTLANLRFSVSPWDDPAFLAAFDRACAGVVADGLTLDEPRGQLAIQVALRADGYPSAVVVCERSVDEALVHGSRCIIRRDG